MEEADKERTQVTSGQTCTHTQHPSVKLTSSCWQWREQTKRENGYFWSNIHTVHMHNTRLFSTENSLADFGNGRSRQGEKQVTSGQSYTHT